MDFHLIDYMLAITVSLVPSCGLLHGLCGWCMVYMDPSCIGPNDGLGTKRMVMSTVVGYRL